MVELNLYQDNKQTSEFYKKWYARADYKQTYGIHELAKHMAEHETPFSEGTIKGILTDAVKCIRHLTLDGNQVKIPNLAIFRASVSANATQRYGIMKAKIGPKTTKIQGVVSATGNAVSTVRLVAVATGAYQKSELNKDAVVGWTKKAQEAIDADKALMANGQPGNGNG